MTDIVWLASYPKSGNTWFRAVFASWQTGGPIDLNKLSTDGMSSIGSSRLRIEAAIDMASSLLTADEIDLLRPRVDEATAQQFDKWRIDDATSPGRESTVDPPMINKIHDALMRGPTGEFVVSTANTRAAVYIIRDPRDVALSFAHHRGTTHGRAVAAMGSPSTALSSRSNHVNRQVRQRLGTWSEHVRSWVDDAPFPVHVVRYEDCVADPVATFAAALRFVGHDAYEDDVASAVEHARFDRLRAQEHEDGFRERPSGVESFFRRGVAGAWRDELDSALVARVEHDHATVMRRFGYDPSTS